MGRPVRCIPNSSVKLSIMESRFVVEYVKDGNGPRSAIDSGWCQKTEAIKAKHIACILLKKPVVIKAIQEQFEASACRNLITVDRVMQEVYRLATYNVQGAYNEDGSCKKISELPEDLARAIEGFEVEEVRGKPGVTVIKYKFAKKSPSQQILLDRIDNIVKRFEVTGANGAPISTSHVDLSDVSIELLKKIVEKGL